MIWKDLFFPKVCLSCGFLGTYICSRCEKKLQYIDQDTCLYCGRKSYAGFTHPGCQRRHGLDGAISLFRYNFVLQRIIKGVKYRLATDIWKEFRHLLKPKILEKLSFYKTISTRLFLQPIPLHQGKLKTRGFNQALLIADFVGSVTGLPVIEILQRIKATRMQAQLDTKKARYDNVRSSFAVTDIDRIKKRQVILVDDVLTTGSTLKEASRVLKIAGAEKVFALTIGKG